jgi:hypothetical membrane protein
MANDPIPVGTQARRTAAWSGPALAGTLFFLAGFLALLGIITAEVLYPGYSTIKEISDLGASRPPDSVIMEPSATIFNTTMVVTGGLVLTGTGLLSRRVGRRGVTVALALFGFGVIGVGFFPGNRVPWHGLFALLTFVSGGVSALAAVRFLSGPFRYLSGLAGTIALLALASAIFLGDANPLLFLGLGGVERWVVYPILLWLIGFGGYLLGVGTG